MTSGEMLRFLDNVAKYGQKPGMFKATCPLCNDGHWNMTVKAMDGAQASPKDISTACKHTREEIYAEVRKRYEEYADRLMEQKKSLPAVREETGVILETGQNVQELLAGMRAMGEMMRVMNERMTAMEQTIRTLEKVTPGQAAEINKRIRSRAAEICREYGMETATGRVLTIDHRADGRMGEIEKLEIRNPDPEKVKELTGAIRKDVREMTGVKTAREIARCDYPAVKEFVESWEDYDVIRRIREKEREAAWKK